MRVTKTTGWSLATTGICVAVATAAWFGLVDPERAAAAQSREQTVAAQATNAELENRIEQLRVEFADLPARQAELAAIRLALPEEPALAQLIRDVNALSADAGTTLDALTTGAPVVVVDPNAGVAPVEDPAAAGAEGSSAEPSAEPSAAPSTDAAPADPAAAGSVAATTPPAGPVLAAVPVTITVSGDFTGSTLMLKNLQADMPRALLVDSLSLSAVQDEEATDGTVQTVITGRVFVFVDPTEVTFPSDAPVSPEPSTEPSDG